MAARKKRKTQTPQKTHMQTNQSRIHLARSPPNLTRTARPTFEFSQPSIRRNPDFLAEVPARTRSDPPIPQPPRRFLRAEKPFAQATCSVIDLLMFFGIFIPVFFGPKEASFILTIRRNDSPKERAQPERARKGMRSVWGPFFGLRRTWPMGVERCYRVGAADISVFNWGVLWKRCGASISQMSGGGLI